MKKTINEEGIVNELRGASAFFSKSTPRSSQRTPQHSAHGKEAETNTEEVTEVRKQLRKDLRKPTRKPISELRKTDGSGILNGEGIEQLSFQLRKEQKARLTTDVPVAWRKELDDLAYSLEVGKYELLMYIIGKFLGKVEQELDV